MHWLSDRLGVDAAGCVAPDYDGGSIVNLPATIGHLLGVRDGWQSPPLTQRAGLIDGAARNVILVVVDGLGFHALERYAPAAARIGALVERYGGRLERITSVVPATTSVATTALLGDGAAPGATGMLGFSQRLPALGVVGNMLFWTELGTDAGLEGLGLHPESFVPTASLFQVLRAGGVGVAAAMPAAIAGSPLSRLQFRGARPAPVASLKDALDHAGSAVSQRSPSFAYVYHPDLDTVSHREGPGGVGWQEVLDAILSELEMWLADLRVPAGTWLLVTADHGLVETPVAARHWLADVPELGPLVAGPPAGEPRHLYLYAREGAGDELLAAARESLGPGFLVFAGRRALEEGLYGDPARLHPEAVGRVGDVVVLPRGDRTIWDHEPQGTPLGMHGALEPEEMHVPLLALPLA